MSFTKTDWHARPFCGGIYCVYDGKGRSLFSVRDKALADFLIQLSKGVAAETERCAKIVENRGEFESDSTIVDRMRGIKYAG